MRNYSIGRVVTGSLIVGHVVAPALAVGPLGGAEEHVITGSVLLVLAMSWAAVAVLSTFWTNDSQRWAILPAGFMGVMGTGLLVFAPRGEVLNALGWIWPLLWLATCTWTVVRAGTELHSRTRQWLVYPLLSVYMLAGFGGGYQTVRESFDRRASAPGQLIDVGGRRLHLQCSGTGTPAVVLESGLGETAAYWGWIAAAVAHDTTVCVYDRAGRGWSDPPVHAQDGVAVTTDLHTLLERAHVPAPFVLVGHSSGAQYVRIFADRFRHKLPGWCCSMASPPKRSKAFRVFQRSTTRFAGRPESCRRWRDSASGVWSSTRPLAICPLVTASGSVSTTRRRGTIAACATSSPNCRCRSSRRADFKVSGIDPWSS